MKSWARSAVRNEPVDVRIGAGGVCFCFSFGDDSPLVTRFTLLLLLLLLPPKLKMLSFALLALAAASPAVAQLSVMRATSELPDALNPLQKLMYCSPCLLLPLYPSNHPPLHRSPTVRTASFRSSWSTVPGALHQCENTNVVFFQTGSDRPLDLLFLPSSSVPDSLRTGTTTIEEAIAYSPLQAIDGITTADNAAYDFELQIAEGTVFEVSCSITAWSRRESELML